MNRGITIFFLIPFLLIFYSFEGGGTEVSSWESYKNYFISSDGRVIDNGQSNISHSEGQGYGMLLALVFNDKEAFDKLWSWTKNNLQVRADGLFAWNWGERIPGRWEVIDYNNATDGDILIALALIKATFKWKDKSYLNEALKIVRSIREKLSINLQGRIFLLPGYFGFLKNEVVILNPSYLIFNAYRLFGEVDEKSFWEKVYQDALYLVSQSNFSSFGLPPDWIVIDRNLKVSILLEKSRYFGDEAIRTLLYYSRKEKLNYSDAVKRVFKLYNELGFIPASIDLINESITLRPAKAGIYAIYAYAANRIGFEKLSNELFAKADEILKNEEKDYYSYTLYLLSKIWDSIEGS